MVWAPVALFSFEFAQGLRELTGYEPDGVAAGDESPGSCLTFWRVEFFSARGAMHISQTEIQSRFSAAGESDRIGILVVQDIRNPLGCLLHQSMVSKLKHPSLPNCDSKLRPSPAPYFFGVNQFLPAGTHGSSIGLTRCNLPKKTPAGVPSRRTGRRE
jgi:hypothetical protein